MIGSARVINYFTNSCLVVVKRYLTPASPDWRLGGSHLRRHSSPSILNSPPVSSPSEATASEASAGAKDSGGGRSAGEARPPSMVHDGSRGGGYGGC